MRPKEKLTWEGKLEHRKFEPDSSETESLRPSGRGVWLGVGMDYVMFQSGPPCPTLTRPDLEKALRPFQRRPAAVLYRFGHPTRYGHASTRLSSVLRPADDRSSLATFGVAKIHDSAKFLGVWRVGCLKGVEG